MRLLQLLQLKSKVLLIKDICAIKNYCIEKIYNSNRVIYCNKCNRNRENIDKIYCFSCYGSTILSVTQL